MIEKKNFQVPQGLVDNLYKESIIDKLKSIIIKVNYWFVYYQLNTISQKFLLIFTLNTQLHKHSNRKNRLILPNVKITCYGSNFIKLKAIKQWNKLKIWLKLIFILPKSPFFLNWDSLHARLNSHYEAWSYKQRNTKKITGYRKSV